MGAVCAFDQGHVYVDDNEKSAGCPKSVVTLPSKYTCFSFPTSSFLQLSSPRWLNLLFVEISRQHQQSVTEPKLLIVKFDAFSVQHAVQIDKK